MQAGDTQKEGVSKVGTLFEITWDFFLLSVALPINGPTLAIIVKLLTSLRRLLFGFQRSYIMAAEYFVD